MGGEGCEKKSNKTNIQASFIRLFDVLCVHSNKRRWHKFSACGIAMWGGINVVDGYSMGSLARRCGRALGFRPIAFQTGARQCGLFFSDVYPANDAYYGHQNAPK